MADRRSLRVWLGITFFLPALAAAQPASLLLDISPAGQAPEGPRGHISNLHVAGDRLYFSSDGGGVGGELWVSDGTPAGTEVLRDLCPGSCSSDPQFVSGLGKLMLWTTDSVSRRQLWRSDGTRPGTFALTPEEVSVQESDPLSSRTAVFRRSLYFIGCTGFGFERDCDLWRTDGSVAGTRVVEKGPRFISWLQVAGDRLYYLEYLGEEKGSDLWVTNGTAAGTVRLRHFEDRFGVSPEVQVAAGNRLFFLAEEGDREEVWTSDGTAAGTRAVTKFAVEFPLQSSRHLRAIGNRVYFVADDGVHGKEIWRTDGTDAGTLRLTDLEEEIPVGVFALAEVNGIVVFKTYGDDYAQLWTTRGTPESAAPLLLPCEDCHHTERDSVGLVESGGKVYFWIEDRGLELWTTDGTAAGSQKIAESLCVLSSCSYDRYLPWKRGLLFEIESRQGTQFWWSNGTPEGTKPFTPLLPDVSTGYPLELVEMGGNVYFLAEQRFRGGLWVRSPNSETRPVFNLPVQEPESDPRHLTALGDRLLFTAWDGTPNGFDLWSSAGTPETTGAVNVPDVSWRDIGEPVRAAGLLFFQVRVGDGEFEIWRTDGTSQGTFRVASLSGGAALVPFQGSLYFFADRKIWKTDGTVQGTVKTGDYPEDLSIVELAVAGPNGIYFKAVTAPYETEFWFTDGTTAGTRQFTSFEGSGVSGGDPEFTTVGSSVYFSWIGLWKTDGTPGGTTLLEGLPAGAKLLSHGGALYFFSSSAGEEDRSLRLWRTNGTAAGTVQLGKFPYQDTFNFPLELTPFAGKLFFNVDDGVHGIELWATDGTPAGTALVRDLFPGPRSSRPTQLTVAGGRLFFTAGDDLHGIELWQSDGTAAGTRLVHDVAPQAFSATPEQLTVAGDKLFFTADDGLTGREVWVLPLDGSSGCNPSSNRLCLSGGRYAVEATWRSFDGRRGPGRAVPLTADTGYFWFFDPANVETVVKVLDGRGVNGHVWVFYGALSNVEYTLTVTDTQTGLSHRYVNPSGHLASVGDTRAFGPLGATAQAVATSVAPPSPLALVDRRVVPSAAKGSCAPSSTRLCLNGSRFAVEIAWKDFEGHTGTGKAVELTSDTGWFWFFDPANVEVVLKVLDGTPVNGHHWVFYGALSNVEYTVTVTDTETGEVNTYRNLSGRLASVADTQAF
ncbi:MAG TPA: ELWxxDGT repeat protein [Thermoanaerobaculia bacterium]|nr:ELWxxDGT repeat protein [Thermoanaerobaculia bacterium]